jgi:hypothetical protein
VILNKVRYPALTIGMLLKVKKQTCRDEWDLQRLCELAGFVNPPDRWKPAELPGLFLADAT